MHSCTQILSLTDVYFAGSSFCLVGVISLLYWPSLQTLKAKGRHFIYSFRYFTEKIKMRITYLPNTKECISAEIVYPFYTAVLMLDYITSFNSCVHYQSFFLPMYLMLSLNITLVTVLSTISEKESVIAFKVVADVLSRVTSVLVFCNFSEHCSSPWV